MKQALPGEERQTDGAEEMNAEKKSIKQQEVGGRGRGGRLFIHHENNHSNHHCSERPSDEAERRRERYCRGTKGGRSFANSCWEWEMKGGGERETGRERGQDSNE